MDEQRLAKHGLKIIPCVKEHPETRRGKMTMVKREGGFCVQVTKANGKKYFLGVNMSRNHTMQGVARPFESIQDAEASCDTLCDLIERRQDNDGIEVRQTNITLRIVSDFDLEPKGMRLQLDLNPRQASVLRQMKFAERRTNREFDPLTGSEKRPVASDGDLIRLILDLVYRNLPPGMREELRRQDEARSITDAQTA